MDFAFYQQLAEDALAGRMLDDRRALQLLTDDSIELLPLLNAAYAVRRHYFGRDVRVHILNNAQNGGCPEDCGYCTQARTSDVDIEAYPIKSEAEILEEARLAKEAGAFRYCMVFAGRGPNEKRTALLADLVRKIKATYNIEVCISAGLLDEPKAKMLAEAGLDRLNHNLNTSRARYPEICTTHTYDDRLSTLMAAKSAGLETCSGLIAGMGETPAELVEIARTLREVHSASIPLNFLLPFEGNRIKDPANLSPEYCLRVIAMFRLMNPYAEVRAAAGREFHLRSMEVLCLYPANSLFLDGYLNGRGESRQKTYQMIRDAGFNIVSDEKIDDLLEWEADHAAAVAALGKNDADHVSLTVDGRSPALKTRAELRPAAVRAR